MSDARPIVLDGVSHFYGKGELRKQVLFEVTAEIRKGEIVIVTGPSGSGKTTLLTLIGALRSTQRGSLRVLGEELRGVRPRRLVGIRRNIGYIFQSHNLLDALTAVQNVEMGVWLHNSRSRSEVRRRATEMLESVGLGDRLNYHPSNLSGGQRQRVAVARALVSEPRIILADEPTASLDSVSGREVVDLMQRLAKEQGVTVLLVTHDNRVLDIADRIVHIEDGRLSSFTNAVISSTRHLMGLLTQSNRRGELLRQVSEMPVEQFSALLEELTTESLRFLEVTDKSQSDAFQSMLEQALQAFAIKIEELFGVERCSIFLIDRARGELWLKVARQAGGEPDRARGELWLKVARQAGGEPLEARIPLKSGIAGQVAETGEVVRVKDAYSHPLFNPSLDESTGFRTRSILCMPIRDHFNRVFAGAQLINRRDGKPFDSADEDRFHVFVRSVGIILESWWRMAEPRRPDAEPPAPAD